MDIISKSLWSLAQQDGEAQKESSSGCEVELIGSIDRCRYTFWSIYWCCLCLSTAVYSLIYCLLKYAPTSTHRE